MNTALHKSNFLKLRNSQKYLH